MLCVEGRDYLQPCKEGHRLLQISQSVSHSRVVAFSVFVIVGQSLDRFTAYDCDDIADSERNQGPPLVESDTVRDYSDGCGNFLASVSVAVK